MLVVKNNSDVFQYRRGDEVTPLNFHGDVVVCVDPSKTNMAVLVGSPFGEIYSIVEFSGNNRKLGPAMDTTEYCSEFSEFLRRYLSNTKVMDCAVEKAITKKGMEHHHSNMVLTEIRGKMLGLFSEVYGIPGPQAEVNNYSWKRAILPEGYRGHGEKGSKRYIQTMYPDSPLCNYFEADATDVFCIYLYRISKYRDKYKIVCNTKEQPLTDKSIGIYPSYMDNAQGLLSFRYNNNFTLEENATFYANRSTKTGIASIDIEKLSLESIYAYATGFSTPDIEENTVRVVVARA